MGGGDVFGLCTKMKQAKSKMNKGSLSTFYFRLVLQSFSPNFGEAYCAKGTGVLPGNTEKNRFVNNVSDFGEASCGKCTEALPKND